MKQQQNIPHGYCQCGCGEKTKLAPRSDTQKGWIRGEPQRYLPLHYGRRTGPLHKLDPETGCLIWQGCVAPTGYGVVTSELLAHRAAYAERHGPILKGMQIHHKCGRKVCCNVDHMELLSAADHARRHYNLPPTPKKWPDKVIREMRALGDAGWEPLAIAEAYGMGIRYCRQILAGGARRDI